MIKLFKVALAGAFLLAASPIVAPAAGVDASAQARPYKKKVKRYNAKTGKYQYQYIPNSNGRTGGWR
jgi:hypothetical protein